MVKVRSRGAVLRSFILDNIEAHPSDIARVTADRFAISRQAINKHLRNLVREKALVEDGNTRNKTYKLCPLLEWSQWYDGNNGLEEDLVWLNDVKPRLGLPDNVLSIWAYCVTEMLNNAIDHSGAARISVDVKRTATTTEICVYDNGIGIFKKIKDALGLEDERHAIFELSKGKLTTDPSRHTGQGIFFSSRMVDQFQIFSSGTFFSHNVEDDRDWLSHEEDSERKGTLVIMRLKNHTARSTKKVFDEYSTGEDLGFTKTVVPVRLAQYGDEQLVSRSQAKRLLARVDRFKTVVMNFEGVSEIGHSFADEIFRVFSVAHPTIELYAINANDRVMSMIDQARNAATEMNAGAAFPNSGRGDRI
jgi:anti-sigma regulatory factor (Ser/Thr protein kinase)